MGQETYESMPIDNDGFSSKQRQVAAALQERVVRAADAADRAESRLYGHYDNDMDSPVGMVVGTPENIINFVACGVQFLRQHVAEKAANKHYHANEAAYQTQALQEAKAIEGLDINWPPAKAA